MKKTGVILVFLLFTILAASLISAANETIDEKAYYCLEGKVSGKCSTLSLEEQQFSLLALAYNTNLQEECKSSLLNKSLNNECWPSPSCKIKDTALSIIALSNINVATGTAENWLMSKNKTSSNLEWYLEIDSSSATECTISYDSTSKKINIAEDKKISGDLGSCLSLAYDNYWMKISNSCLNKKFIVTCKNDFISTILYKKKNSNIWFVTPEVKSASANGNTEHEINSYCFGTGTDCIYEDNLWAAFALERRGITITPLLPYLIAFSEDNEKLFPSSFLYYLTDSEDYLAKLLSLQKSDGYWLLNQKFYDTALAMTALSELEAETNAKTWLKTNQGNDGCWNSGNIRDTAFLLWAGWPRAPVFGGGGGEIPDCTEYGKYCLSRIQCTEAGGNDITQNYGGCGAQICCDRQAIQQTCTVQGGEECANDEECSISLTTASDTDKCCLNDKCVPKTQENECEEADYSCRTTSCSSNEEPAESYDCPDTGKVCCKPKATEEKSYWWLWLLIILIILVVLGIIFRNKLRIWIFKIRGGFKQGEVQKTRPPFYPPSGMRPTQSPFQRPVFRPMPTQTFPQPRTLTPQKPSQIPRKSSKSDEELEDTLKKLKEMSK